MGVWARVGLNSFGGPAGQIAVMHREIVDDRRWISERRFLHALNFCMVLPGPEAQQLATYIGWLMHGIRGGITAGIFFVLPGFVVMMALSLTYAVYGEVNWIAGLLFGLQAAVLAIVVQAVIRVGRRTLYTRFLVGIAAAAFLALFVFGTPFPVVIIVAGLLGWLVGRVRPRLLPASGPGKSDDNVAETPHLLSDDEQVTKAAARKAKVTALVCLVIWLTPVVLLGLLLGSDNFFTQQAHLFSKSAVVTFGGAYAVLAYISQQAVQAYGWISAKDMAVGLGLAETTPGPLIMVVQFVAFLAAYNNPGALSPIVAGVLAATLAVWVTFVPCFMFIFVGAPYVERLRNNKPLHHALTTVGAAVVGVILNLALWFAITTMFGDTQTSAWGPVEVLRPAWESLNGTSLAIAVLAVGLVFKAGLSTMKVLGVCALVGMLAVLLVPGVTT
jgi:chromate transporter